MPQPIRPASTVSTGEWTAVGGTHHAVLADDVDTSYIECPVSSSPTLELLFDVAQIVYPVIGSPTAVVRARKTAAGGNTRNVSVQLVVNGTVTGQVDVNGLTEVYATASLPLPAVTAYEAPAVTSTAVRVVASGQTGGKATSLRGVQVASLAIAYPDLAYVCDGMGGPDGDHCDYVPGEPGGVCRHLVVNAAANPALGERKYRCAMRDRMPWPDVHVHPDYAPIKAVFDASDTPLCGDWFGGTRSMLAAAEANGEITELEYLSLAQCCFARAKFTTDAKGRGQAVGWVNRVTFPGKGG